MAETEVPEIELIIKASTIDGRRKGACIFCQVIRWFSLRFNRQTVRLVNVSTSASLCTENTVVGSFLASKIANCCVRFLGIFHGFVSVGWTEDNLSQDHDCRHEETPSRLQEQLWSKTFFIFQIDFPNFRPRPPSHPSWLITEWLFWRMTWLSGTLWRRFQEVTTFLYLIRSRHLIMLESVWFLDITFTGGQ